MRCSSSPVLFLLFSLIASWSYGLDPHRLVTQYSQRHWTTKDGLPLNSIESIIQTRDGYIWVGTQEGLARFDGVQFTVFDKTNTSALLTNWITTLKEDRQGNLWIGTWGGGVIKYSEGMFHTLPPNVKLPSNYVNAILEDNSGNLWVGTGEGLVRISNGSTEVYTTQNGLNGNSILSLAEDSMGSLWIGTIRGLNRMFGGRLEKVLDVPASEPVLALYPDFDGSLWIGTSSGSIARLHQERYISYALSPSGNRVREIFRDRSRNLWIGSDAGGLKRFDNGTVESLPLEHKPGAYEVSSIFEDAEENLWVGTTLGLIKLSDGKLVPFGVPEGLSEDFVWTILGDSDGKSLWIGTFNGGLNHFDEGRIRTFKAPGELSSNAVTSLHQDRAGTLWIGTRGGGLNQYQSGRFRSLTSRNGLTGDWIQSIYEDRDHTLWIGTYGRGLSRLKDGKFMKKENGFPGNSVSAILQDQEGVLWFGAENGLVRWKNGDFQLFDSRNGLSGNDITCLLQDRTGAFWIGTASGLNLYRNGSFVPFTQRDGLYNDHILGILEDDSGNLWMSSNKGIFRVRTEDLVGFASGRQKSIRCVVYGESDGMRSAECNGGYPPSAWKTSDGKLWFPTVQGVVTIDPGRLRINTVVPTVRITQSVIDDQIYSIKGKQSSLLTIGPGTEKLEFHYTALSYRSPEKVQFRYLLEGFDHQWGDAGTRRVAYYTNLPPKHYRFRVIACNEDGVWNRTGASLHFYLKPHFYQTTWFYLLCIFAFVLAAFGAHRLRLRQLKTRFLLVLKERTRIARDLHDTMAQSISGVVLQLDAARFYFQNKPDESQQHLLRAADLARDGLLQARRAVWQLRDPSLQQGDIFQALVDMAQQMSVDSGIPIKVVISGNPLPLPESSEEQLLRISQEGITNALKHANAQEIQVELKFASDLVQLSIDDNGRGFDILSKPTSTGQHFGLAGMQERVKQLRGTFSIDSKPGRGTTITVSIPLRNSSS